jgi:hypothetical protein
MFSGGDYEEVARWLENFVRSHAKRVSPRIEAALDAEGPREGRSYGVQLQLGDRVTELPELDYREVADSRGNLRWGKALADRVREHARQLISAAA